MMQYHITTKNYPPYSKIHTVKTIDELKEIVNQKIEKFGL